MLKFIFLSIFVCLSLTGCGISNDKSTINNNNEDFTVSRLSTENNTRFY